MTDYTPTTEWVIAGWTKARASDGVTADVAFEEIDRWFAEELRKAKAEGFDEGWDARVNAETITPTENPYRQGETE